jgi:hypothetical protein
MPNRCVEIHDSILTAVSFSQGEGQLHFSSVYIHQSEGAPGCDAGSGWTQQAIVRINNARVEGSFFKFPVTLSEGSLQLGNETFDNEIPVPLRHNGSIALRLIGSEGGEVVFFTGSGSEFELLGDPKCVEEFRP